MAVFLQIENLTKSFGDRLLFADLNLTVNEGDKIGVVARNGYGKSTLLDIIAGNIDYDDGNIIFRNGLKIAYLPQKPVFDDSKSLLDNVAVGDADPLKAAALLSKLDLDDHQRSPKGMSGGELKRAAIARALASEPDFLMLDEPTNHLDVATVEWLEKYLSTQRTTLLMVTHDRYFLDNVCNRILEIDRNSAFVYDGNFDYYLEKHAEREENLASENIKIKNLLRTEREWMRRQPQARGSKAKYRIDNFHDLERRSHLQRAEGNVSLEIASSYIGSKILEVQHISKAYGEKRLFSDFSYTFARGEKIGIVGENGAGKSTLIKILMGLETPDSGALSVGQTVKWGYYSQDGMIDIDPKMKVIDAVREIAEEVRIDDKTRLTAMQFLTRFLFTPERQQQYVYRLSGGELRRLYLATVLMRQPNFLVLDEPTNDLDIITLAVLEDYLANFKGCVMVVSHDRFFLDRIADHLFVLEGDGVIRDFPGSYSNYRHCKRVEERERKEARAAIKDSTPKQSYRPKRESKGLSFKEKREKERLEALIPQLEDEKTRLEAEMSSGDLSHDDLSAKARRVSEIINDIDEGEMRLLELMEKE